jgi:Linalool dehydratase/isomerase
MMLEAVLRLPDRSTILGPITISRLCRLIALYVTLVICCVVSIFVIPLPAWQAFAFGLVVPGGGFAYWAGPEFLGDSQAIGLAMAAVVVFATSIVLWFSTGNALLPPAVLIVLAAVSSQMGRWQSIPAPPVVWSIDLTNLAADLAIVIATSLALSLGAQHASRKKRAEVNSYLATIPPSQIADATSSVCIADELSIEDLQLMRLIFDRALQPIENFEGFEWVDQFQTSAVRYQLNFMSYALSVTQSVHLPAFSGYLSEAQSNLVVKQQDYRIWKYWQFENAWGNLRADPDPIPRDNIMFSGFVAAQLNYAANAAGQREHPTTRNLVFAHPRGQRFEYSPTAIIEALHRGFRDAEFGLLSCEPNWIYPLCNAITASAIRAHDTAAGTAMWDEISPSFRKRLEGEFITARGRFIPCRSNYTGLAVPPIGGLVIQAFPCLFFNTIFPDIALRQWNILRRELTETNMRRLLWPVDVGNYRFSRASSYAACAAAAVEMGDADVAKLLFQGLNEDCPMEVVGGVAHRDKASLWAHAVELIARCGKRNALYEIVNGTVQSGPSQPYLKHVIYPDVLVARALSTKATLSLVLHSGRNAGYKPITVGGLVPDRRYVIATDVEHEFVSQGDGEAVLQVPVHRRTEIQIRPAA